MNQIKHERVKALHLTEEGKLELIVQERKLTESRTSVEIDISTVIIPLYQENSKPEYYITRIVKDNQNYTGGRIR